MSGTQRSATQSQDPAIRKARRVTIMIIVIFALIGVNTILTAFGFFTLPAGVAVTGTMVVWGMLRTAFLLAGLQSDFKS